MENENINFEETMQKLEKIAQELENNDLDLDSSIKKFEQGMELSNKCKKILEDAEKRISILVNSEDKLIEKNFIEEV